MSEYKYKPTTWIGGKTIGTADVMNNIEDGIEKAHERLDNISFDDVIGNIDLSEYAKKTDIPTVPTNISAFINDKGYLTEHQDISGKADKTELHNHTNKVVLDGITNAKVAEWDNKSTFDGNYNSLTNKPTIPTVSNDLTNTLKSNYDKAYTHSQSSHAPANAQKNSDITKVEIEAKLTGNITSHTHSQYLTEHQDISGLATKEYVDNAITNLNIDIDYDSLLAFDTNEIITNSNYVDSNNNIILDDDLPSGTYTLKYEFEDGTYIDIKNFTIKNEPSDKPSGDVVNVLEEAELKLNQRYSQTNNAFITAGGVVSLVIPFTNINNDTMMLSFSNLKYHLLGGNSGLYILDNNKSNGLYVNGNGAFSKMTSGVKVASDGLSGTVTFVPPINEGYLAISLRLNDTNATITATDFKDYVITLTTVKEIIENEPIEIDVMKESEKYLNQRWSKTSNDLVTQLGRVALIFPINAVNIDTVCTITIENSPINLKTYRDYLTMYFLNDSKTETFDPQEGANPGYYNSFVWSSENKSCTFSITVVPSCKHIVLNLPLKASAIEAIESDLNGLIITCKKEGVN